MDESDRRYWACVPILLMQQLRALREHFGGTWTMNQVIVMLHVSLDDVHGHPCTASGIAETEGMNQQAVSNALHALREAGYVQEDGDPQDARKRLLTMTDKYRSVRKQVACALMGAQNN